MKVIKINAIWCPGCLVMAKIWKKVIEKFPDLEIVTYDYDFDEEIVQTYNPGKILPVNIFFKDDIEIGRLTGERTQEEIEAYLQ